MQVETLRDVLHWTKVFHQELSQRLSHGAGKNIDERAQILLSYLSDHEKSLTKALSGFQTSGEEHALNTWFYEYIQKHPIIRHVHCDAPFAELDARQIMEVIVDQHQQVIELYRHLESQAVIPSAIELLATLRSLEEHESMRMTHAANRFDDM
jgi:hypothetical protein